MKAAMILSTGPIRSSSASPRLIAVAAAAATLLAACSHATSTGARVRVKPSVPRVVQASADHPGWAVFSPVGNAGIVAIAPGFSTHMWASLSNAESGHAELLRVAFDGTFDAISLTAAQADPAGLIAGPRGDMWVAEPGAGKIGEITMPDGPVVDFALKRAGAVPIALALGDDRDIWYVDGAHGIVGKMTSSGVTIEYDVPGMDRGTDIAAGQGGLIWFCGLSGDIKTRVAGVVGTITAAGKVREFQIAGSHVVRPTDLTVGGDGNGWVAVETRNASGQIVRVTPTGSMSAYDAKGQPDAIVANGVDKVDYTLADSPSFGEITTSGQVSTLPLPGGPNARATAIAVAPDGDEWFAGSIGSATALFVRLPSKIDASPASISLDAAGASQKLKVTEKKYTGKWTVQSSDDGIADATGGKLSGEFTVVAISEGSCTLTIADKKGDWITVPVTVK